MQILSYPPMRASYNWIVRLVYTEEVVFESSSPYLCACSPIRKEAPGLDPGGWWFDPTQAHYGSTSQRTAMASDLKSDDLERDLGVRSSLLPLLEIFRGGPSWL